MPLSDIVSVQITTETAKVQQAGFGVPLITSYNAAWSERVREYTDLAGLVTDGFGTTTAEYKAAAEVFAQNPRPEKVLLGRCANKPTQRWAITPVVANNDTYKMKVNGTEVSYISDGTATMAEIIAGLKTAIDALGLAITVSDQTTFMRIVANAAGTFFTVESENVDKIGVAQDHADPGIAADLAAIALERSDWYALVTTHNSMALVLAAAAWVESNTKLYLAATQDSAILTTAKSGTDDVAEALQAAGYARTIPVYHPSNGSFIAHAWGGACLPKKPGSETWAYKTLAGVSVYPLTATHKANLAAKGCNWYEDLGGVNVTRGGNVAAGEYIDVVRFRDWVVARMQESIFGAIANLDKLPFTDAGIAIVESLVRGVLQEGVDVGGFSNDPAPKVQVPKASAVSDADKAARRLTNVKFDAILAGAIHQVVLSGTISV